MNHLALVDGWLNTVTPSSLREGLLWVSDLAPNATLSLAPKDVTTWHVRNEM